MPLEIFKELETLKQMSTGCVVSLSLLNRDIGILLNETDMLNDEQLATAACNVGVSLRHVADYLTAFCDCAERLSNCLGDGNE